MPVRRFLVIGLVQNVGYRWFTQRTAIRQGIHGFVRNRTDGTVEVVAEGDDRGLDRFRESLRRGPHTARVDRLSEEVLQSGEQWSDFHIK
jgi:acylphosphatase